MSGEALAFPIDIFAPRSAALPAFEAAYRVHASRMKSIAYNLLGNEQDAEDAVQEAFLKACRGAEGFQGDAAAHTWVYRILINLCLDEGRRRSRRPVVDVAVEAESGQAGADLRFAPRQAIAQLDPRRRAVFLMAAVEGLPHAEIAAVLETSEANSHTLLLDARRQLQEMLRR